MGGFVVGRPHWQAPMQPLRAQPATRLYRCVVAATGAGTHPRSSQWRWRPPRRAAMIRPGERRSHVLEGGAGLVWFLELTAKGGMGGSAGGPGGSHSRDGLGAEPTG
jgi:hypothetical protein